ncbi:MAG: polymerase III subunit beta protein [Parcubacteria group bacterium GW2011_GWA1_47_11]|uniref:Beta sliding clamp n=1 Tax=Candidatus Yanofskybacteria bacterium RIFCSPHIGHO2_01_FULL_48_25b TaxID=1802672 RepID=A0A1F8EZY6_9BACT|nr:MAG: polymerase III subunit beta protein [Parcubacteria group bacterium GW2011_GWA1_47_11]OGN06442.1 MAG: DNA polymerase III subunit beta [Candidatus Yanofskybacteria bacterium RIFCSPHIGHO2_01_FULL_48_25b]
MKLLINHRNLKRVIGLTEKVVSRNTSLPILNNILLRTENGRLKISATNLELGINALVGVKIEEVGEVAVPARILSDFVNAIKDEKVSLATKSNILHINTEHYKTKILGFDPKDFPIIPKIESEPVASIPAGTLKNGLSKVLDSMAVSETRPELAGVFVQIHENRVVLVSTDIFRLTEMTLNVKTGNETSFILPRNTVAELVRLCGEVDGDIQIKYVENQVAFLAEDLELVSRVVDGTYPPYKNVIPEKFISKALAKKDELENAIHLAGLFSSQISDIKISCLDDKLNISAQNSDKGEIQTEVPVVLKNEPFELSLNYRYMLDGLKNMPDNEVVLEFTGPGSPFVIRPSSDKSLVYLIMPLRN